MLDFESIQGFDWDAGNRDKNSQKHAVSVGECEEVSFNLPLLLQFDPVHSQAEARYFSLGQTNLGRHLFIAFTIRSEKIRIISARDMSRKEKKIYEQSNT
ncbi:MAG: BrnT family toxin [Anaerolineales bacterium]